eukprot:TCONS_00001010-protein
MAAVQHVLLSTEAELLVKALDVSSLEKVGDKRWWNRHDMLEKLNIQSIMNIPSNSCFITENLLTHGKISLVINELITSEIWSERIFPILYHEMSQKDQSTLPVYMTLFHEATVAGLVESVFYYKEVSEEAGDFLLDLIDYAYRKLTKLISKQHCESITQKDPKNDLLKQNEDIQFTIAMKCISIIKYICDAMDSITLSAITRILNTHDFPYLLSQLIDLAPWKKRKENGEVEIFTDNKWVIVPKDETHLLPKIEGQVWLTLYQLLLHPEAQRKYEYNSHRKTQLLKLRRYLHELLLDQLPYLSEVQRFLENLSVMDPPPSKQDLIIEQIPEVRNKLERMYEGRWNKIAKTQLQQNFTMSSKDMKEHAQRLAATYDLDILESLIDEAPTCSNCQNEATKRCSRCQNEWYCSRPCQVKHWSKHKELCNILSAK